MLSAFNERINILKINISNSYQLEMAYFANNWAGLLSTLGYTLTYLLFINIVFANIKNMAGYSRDEVLFLTMMGQLSFYILATFSMNNADQLIRDVNRGNLDLILLKPLPTLFYVSLRYINLLSLLRNGGIPVFFIIIAIHWTNLHLTAFSIICGIIAFIFGLIASDTVKFLLSIPVFWKGEAQELSGLYYSLIDDNFPWEGLNPFMRMTFAVLVPVFISVPVATSIFLNKSSILPLLVLAVAVGSICLWIKSYVWKVALRNYTSASS